jgi:hypothetical protein
LPAGEIFAADRLAAATAGSRALRDMPGMGLRKRRQATGWRISEASEPGSKGALADVGLGSKTRLGCRVSRATGIKASGTLETRALE